MDERHSPVPRDRAGHEPLLRRAAAGRPHGRSRHPVLCLQHLADGAPAGASARAPACGGRRRWGSGMKHSGVVYLTGGSLISLLLGIIVTIIIPAQEPLSASPLARPYRDVELRGRALYLREGCQ